MQIVGKTMLNYLFVLQMETLRVKNCPVSMLRIAKSVQVERRSVPPDFVGPETHRSSLWSDSSVAAARQCK